MKITRGSIWLANLGKPDAKTSIQKNTRPVIIVSNDMCNTHSPVITAIPLTTRNKNCLPTHVIIPTSTGIMQESTALVEQAMPLDIHNLIKEIGCCNESIMMDINKAILIQNGIDAKLIQCTKCRVA